MVAVGTTTSEGNKLFPLTSVYQLINPSVVVPNKVAVSPSHMVSLKVMGGEGLIKFSKEVVNPSLLETWSLDK